MASPSFWERAEEASRKSKRLSELKGILSRWEKIHREVEELDGLFLLAEESLDPSLREEGGRQAARLLKEVEKFEWESLLSGPYDSRNAIVSFHPGAGGVDSQDWAAMLLRMYLRWAEGKGYQVEMLDYLEGEEAGIKSATVAIKGPCAYGFLRAEKGVHRLVRISPFDAQARRHTSFASVEVLPEVEEEEVEIRPEDLVVETFRASGHGGQHVNKTESAVRITHLPTGITASCQAERSQFANRETALRILKARLAQWKEEQREKELAALRGERKEIAWGQQIRSYVFHPYTLVKDHRTGVERGDIQAVMDGDIDDFIYAYLEGRVAEEAGEEKARPKARA